MATQVWPWRVGIDVGGTHTDVIVSRGETVTHGKALTTPRDLSEGVLAGIEVVASSLGMTVPQLLRDRSNSASS
jgi:N-methylhydantoinase A